MFNLFAACFSDCVAQPLTRNVDKHVNASELLEGRLNRAFNVLQIREIEFNCLRRSAGYFSIKSAKTSGFRAVTTTRSPFAKTSSAKMRPESLDVPVINQTLLWLIFFLLFFH